MQQLTLTQLFGLNATQSNSHLIINKNDLPKLLAKASNTAESLLTAILLRVAEQFYGNLTDPNEQDVLDSNNQKVSYDNSEVYEKIKLTFWKHQFITVDEVDYRLDTFVIDAFFTPPPDLNSPINLALWG